MPGITFKTKELEIKYYLKRLRVFGLSEIDFRNINFSPYEIVCKFAENHIIHKELEKEYHELCQIYYAMAIIADQTNQNSAFELLRKSKYWDLINHYEQSKFIGIKHQAKIITAKDACEFCKNQFGKTYSIEQALELMPLPHLECTKELFTHLGFCRCLYIYQMAK